MVAVVAVCSCAPGVDALSASVGGWVGGRFGKEVIRRCRRMMTFTLAFDSHYRS